MAKRRRGGRQMLLCFVDFVSAQGFKPRNLSNRQVGEQAQEPADVGVLGVAPELPIVVRRKHLLIEPHRPGHGFAHLGARCRGQKRGGQSKQRPILDAPA